MEFVLSSLMARYGMKITIMVMTALLFSALPLSAEAVAPAGQMETDIMEPGAKTIVVIGASYAGGWVPEGPISGYRIINKGINGQQSFEMLARFEMDVLSLKPDAVIIWGFINDIFRSDIGQIEETLKRTRASLFAMVDLARKSGVTPILSTEVTIRGKDGWLEAVEALIGKMLGKSSYQDYVNGHVIETNRWIQDLAKREKLLLLDLKTVLSDQRGVRLRAFSQPDGSHISKLGYEAITRYTDHKLKNSMGLR